MIKVIPLGVNGAFTKYYHNNYVFELGNRKLLVDAGTSLRYSLNAAGIKENDITDVVITHLHSDHVGGLEEFAQHCKWIYNHKPNLWIRSEMAGGLHNILQSGLCTDGLKLSDYFNVIYRAYGFDMENFEIEFMHTDNLHSQNMLSMGLKINDIKGDKNIIFTSDIADHETAQFDDYFEYNTVALFHDVSFVKNPVHSFIDDVVDYYKNKIELSKVYGMHYQDDIDINSFSHFFGINFVQTGKELEF